MENIKDTQQKNTAQHDQKQTDPKQHDQKQHDQHDQKQSGNKPNTDNQKKPAQGIEDGKQTPRPTVVPSTQDHENKEPEKKRA